MKQIVCLSTSPWYPIPTRKQQVMSRLSDAEILYFDPSVTWLAPLKEPAAREKLRAHKRAGEKVRENITVYTLPPVMPFFNKYRWINRLNQKKVARYVNRKCREHGFDSPLVWVYSPTAADCVDRIDKSGLVYDCVDRHSAYGGLMDPAVVDSMEMELAAKADMVFATAKALHARLAEVNPRARCIPNGANFERFVQASAPQECPADFPGGEGPVFGFVGALQSCIEYGFIAHAAKARPDWRFVFLGRKVAGVDLSALEALPNCHFLGLRPNEQLPAYLAQCDVCLNLFDNSDLSRDVSPLKFFEYLATGKPIVSTAQPEQVLQYAGDIHIADTPEAFLDACERALTDTSAERTARRIELGQQCSWDSRVAQMEQELRALDIL